jgi:transposase-like protein
MSQRLRCLAALAWSMGLSLRGVGKIFSFFGEGLGMGRSSVWRAVQEKGEELRRRAKAQQHKHRVRVLGVDGAWIRLNGETTGVMVAVDMGNGQMVSMEVIDEHDPQAVCRWLKPLVSEFGVEVIVTDDLTTYNTVEEELGEFGVERQLCRFHMLRWVGKSLLELEKKLEGEEDWPQWPGVVAEVRQLVEEMPPKGDERLLELWQEVHKECGWRKRREQDTPLQKLARLILGLMENWGRYRLYLTERGAQLGVPSTNNLTEQMIGNGKIRSRTVRGYKSRAGVLAAFMVCAARLA